MSIKKYIQIDILIVIILTVLAVVFFLAPSLSDTPVRALLGMLIAIFLPGYALIAALFPGRRDLKDIKRVGMSFGLSIAVVPFIGLGLNYTQWGISRVSILVSLSAFILFMCIIALKRRTKLPKGKAFCEFKDNYLIIAPVLMIIIAEMLLLSGKYYISICVHVLTFITLSLSTMRLKDSNIHKPLQALMLLPLLRLVNISMPIFFDMTLYTFVFVYAPLLIPIYLIAVQQKFTLSEMGLTSKKIIRNLPVAVLIGMLIGQGEYLTIKASYLIPDLSIVNILKLSIVMIFFVGLVEELIFRSILQTRLEQAFGMFSGLLLTSILFGMMHSAYGTPYEIAYTALAGLALGNLFQRTKNLPVTAIAHGFVNIFLFGLIPHLGPGLGILQRGQDILLANIYF